MGFGGGSFFSFFSFFASFTFVSFAALPPLAIVALGPEPGDFFTLVETLPQETQHLVMRDNARRLLGLD